MDKLISFSLARDHGTQDSELQRTLKVCFAYQRATSTRRELVSLLAGCSIGVWISAVWPSILSGGWRIGIEVLWAMCSVFTLLALLAERRWQRKWNALALPPGPVIHHEDTCGQQLIEDRK